MSADPASAHFGGPSPLRPLVPPTREFGWAWLSYGLAAFGLFLLWPALVAVVVSLFRKGALRGTAVGTHHSWLLRTLAFTTLGYVACIVLVFVGAWDLIVAAIQSEPTGQLNLDWGAVLTTAGTAVLGGLGMTVVWFWTAYRLVKGALRLSDGRPVP